LNKFQILVSKGKIFRIFINKTLSYQKKFLKFFIVTKTFSNFLRFFQKLSWNFLKKILNRIF
jgi:hypothetical protein